MSERFVAEGACGGEYAVVWDRKRKQIIFPYLRTGASLSDDQIRAIANELNGLLTGKEIGNVLDHWEQLPNDLRLDPGFERLDKALSNLYKAVIGNA